MFFSTEKWAKNTTRKMTEEYKWTEKKNQKMLMTKEKQIKERYSFPPIHIAKISMSDCFKC